MVSFESREEWSFVVYSLYKRVDSVSISANWGNNDTTMLVFYSFWGADSGSTTFDSFVVNSGGIVYSKSDVFNTVTVLNDVFVDLSVWAVVVKGWLENINDLSITDDVSATFSVTCLKTLTCLRVILLLT